MASRDAYCSPELTSDEEYEESESGEEVETTPIHLACRNPDPKSLRQIIEQSNELVMLEDPSDLGRLPIHVACHSVLGSRLKAIECVKILLEYHPEKQLATPDQRDKFPLHVACEQGDPELVQLLLKYELISQLTHQDDLGRVPLYFACVYAEVEIVRMLLQHNPIGQVMSVDQQGQLPLHIACQQTDVELIQLLLEHQPDEQVLQIDNGGRLPLARLRRPNTKPQCAKMLLAHRGDQQIKKGGLVFLRSDGEELIAVIVELFVNGSLPEKCLEGVHQEYRDQITQQVAVRRRTKSARA